MVKVPLGFFCSMEHLTKHARDKTQKQRETKQNQAKIAHKKNFYANDRTRQLSLTQSSFNKMRRLEEFLWFRERGLEPTCISCGNPIGNDQWCCGHFKTRGSQSNLRFDRKNTFLQHNNRCNKNLSGDIEGTKTTRGYKKGLIERFGEKDGQDTIDYCESNSTPYKWTCEELIELRKTFNKKIRDIVNHNNLETRAHDE